MEIEPTFCIKLDLKRKDYVKRCTIYLPLMIYLKYCWQKGEVHHAEGNKLEI